MKLTIPQGDAGPRFQLWEYRVSHRQLLIRCPKLSDSSQNVDVKFYDVEYVDLPSIFDDVEIVEPDQDDITFATNRVGKPVERDRVFVVKSGDNRHVVIAGAVVDSKSSRGLFESPFTLPPIERTEERSGRITSTED